MKPLTLLCIACNFKGNAFLEQAKADGHTVYLITKKKLENEPWLWTSIDEVFYVNEENDRWNIPALIKGVSYLSRTKVIDRIVPLDEHDMEKATALREHLRVPGMGETRVRYFRDKIAMRMQAEESGILCPTYVHVLNHEKIKSFIQSTPSPWILKPRMEASTWGIRKVYHEDELWNIIHELGDDQSNYILEQFVTGDVYHVDSIIAENEVMFTLCSQYLQTPLKVYNEGGIFRTINLVYQSADDLELKRLQKQVLKGMGLLRGIAHSEFLKSSMDGKFYFIETSARVGGAHISEMVEAASGLNLWKEWAKIETITKGSYKLPKITTNYSGVIISVVKDEQPNDTSFSDPEIFYRVKKNHHLGFVLKSDNQHRLMDLLNSYQRRFLNEFI